MYSSENAVLGTTVLSAPTIFGLLVWPDFVLLLLGAIMAIMGLLFMLFKVRNRKNT